jgi:four helix bundle protein
MVRAADSVGANIAEGSGRYGPADQRRLLFIARGSACELEHWIERAHARTLVVPDEAMEEAMQISRMLNGLIRKLPSHT